MDILKFECSEKFSIFNFFIRYIVGGEALNSSKKVTRQALEALKIGADYSNKDAIALYSQIESFKKSLIILEDDIISLDKLNKVNKSLTSENFRAGKIRNYQNWVGGDSIEKADYIPPPSHALPSLLNEIISKYNSEENYLVSSIAVHALVMNAHPYDDGNGRVSRVLLESKIKKNIGDYIPISIGRFLNNSSYVKCLKTSRIDKEKYESNIFWKSTIQRNNKLTKIFTREFESSSSKLRSYLSLRNINEGQMKIINSIWENPLVSVKSIATKSKKSEYSIAKDLESLSGFGIFKPWRMHGEIVYECSEVFNLWKKFDDTLIKENLNEHIYKGNSNIDANDG